MKIFHKGTYAVSETPLGIVKIELEDIDQTGVATENFYPLQKTNDRMAAVSGDVHLRLRFNRPTTVDLRAAVDGGDIEQQGTGGLTAGEVDEEPPNELHVIVHAARNLLPVDKPLFGEASADPQVKLTLDGFQSHTTNSVKKNLNPNFKDQEYIWANVLDPGLSLSVTVEDYNLTRPTFIGRVAIPLHEFDTKRRIRRWYKLRNKEMSADGVERGEVEISVHWVFSIDVKKKTESDKKKYDRSALGKLTKGVSGVLGQVHDLTNKVTGHVSDEDSDDGLEDAVSE